MAEPSAIRSATDLASEQAQAAWAMGREAMAAGEPERARTWFARACRIAPSDPTPLLSLAGACLETGRAGEAAGLFGRVARATNARIAWLGRAAACLRLGDAAAAAAALHVALAQHAQADGGPASLAEAVVDAVGGPGWCGLDGAGRLIGRARNRTLRGQLDGHRDHRPECGDVVPAGFARLAARAGGAELLGSPIDLVAIRRLEGLVECDPNNGGLTGWAWHPGDPQRVPVLTLVAGRARHTVRATDATMPAIGPLTEPRAFCVSARMVAGLREPIAVFGPDGTPLAGSPISPKALAAIAPAPVGDGAVDEARAPRCPDRPVAVVVPVFRGAAETVSCLADLETSVPAGTAVLVVDDASPEPDVVAAIDALARSGRLRVLRHPRNLGFPAAANTGLRAAMALQPMHDVVLLNSDTRLAAGWLERLRGAVQASDDIGTATPLSNDGSLASYPGPSGGDPPPTGRDLEHLATLVERANSGSLVDVPTGVGFCLYLRHECVAATGLLREDVFAQGYGEENDLCLRASRLGWRHVVAAGVYVAHIGGRSFGAARAALLGRNLRVLERLHPGYRAGVERWIAADPLASARRRIDIVRWHEQVAGAAVLLVTHDDGGGVERCVQDRVRTLRASGHRPILLRPVLDARAAPSPDWQRTVPGRLRIDAPGFDNLIFDLADERDEVVDLLAAARPAWLEVHHRLGHAPGVLDLAQRLGVAYEMRLHDYAAFCPRITLTSPDRYCGEPDVAGCRACVAAHGTRLAEAIDPGALRDRSAAELAGARRVVVPSADMARRMGRHFGTTAFTVEPHEADPDGGLTRMPDAGERRVVVIGAIGVPKGFDVLLACARDAAARRLALRFLVVGRTVDDEALLGTGCVEVTGPYREGEAAGLIAEQGGHLAFIPSVWPETWCFALGEAFAAGLAAAAFDLGAQAERIRRTGRGWLLPLGAPSAAINRLLLAPPALSAARLAASANVMQTSLERLPTDPRPSFESRP